LKILLEQSKNSNLTMALTIQSFYINYTKRCQGHKRVELSNNKY